MASPTTPQTALVVGGGSGIGAAVVAHLTTAGMKVICADIEGERAQQVAAQNGATPLVLDATQHQQVQASVSRLGVLQVLVNCAGADQHAFFTKTTPAEWQQWLAVNLYTVLNTTHAVLPGMQAAQYGRIINVASEAGRLGSRGGAVYAAAKGGVIAFTRSIARENGQMNITANVVAPGPIDTLMLQHAVATGGERLMRAMTDATLVRRLGTPSEVAASVAFLASPEAGFITGEVLGVSGGMGCGA